MTREELARHLKWRYPVWRKKRRFLLAAMPKSGSTFVAQFLAHLIDGEKGFGGQIPGRNEQDLAPFWLWANQGKNIVAHMHSRYHPQTQVYLDHFRMEPIVCVRNLADVIPSVVDHWRQNNLSGEASWPFAHVHPHLMSLSDNELHEFAAIHVIPWYVNFYVSWMRRKPTRAPIVTYDDVFAPGHPELLKLADLLGFGEGKAQAAISFAGGQFTRKNVGKAGRGAALPCAVHQRIEHAISYYPDIDWSPVWVGYQQPRAQRA